MRTAQELLRRNPEQAIVLYGGEPWEPYNRVRLSSVLSGEARLEGIQNPLRLPAAARVVQRHNCPVVRIDREHRRVIDALGQEQAYSALVLATGSTPHIPAIPGLDKPGIFTFRDLDDTQRLLARRTRSRHTIVLGGGLLGLEAARGLQLSHTEVTVVDHSPHLMASQLDEEAAERLRERILSLGIQVLLQDGVGEVLGETRIEGLRLRSGRVLPCDTLVIATGIRPNIQLALEAGIVVGRGIRVDDRMRTSDPHIHAVGECAEHRGRVYGLVAPGLEQAAVAAHALLGGRSQYRGSPAATRLKIASIPVFSMGRTGLDEAPGQLQMETHQDLSGAHYRKLILHHGRLVGAMAIGDWPDLGRVQECVDHARRLWPWQRARFRNSGRLWPVAEAEQVAQWPAGATVCNCTGVTRGTLSQALAQGCTSVERLAQCTGASTVCGSCRPLLAELLGGQVLQPEAGSRTLLGAALLAVVLALACLLLPAIPYNDSVQAGLRWDRLWRDGLFKQVSGFALLGGGLLISAISLRKRIGGFSLGGYPGWRRWHVLAGTLLVAVLIAHTGLRMGHELNLLLMLSFVGLLLAGALASGVIGLQHALPQRLARRTRSLSLWTHILLLWPLPALLGFHVLKTYWF
jgi:nitrite reductase (NADH) large subunit